MARRRSKKQILSKEGFRDTQSITLRLKPDRRRVDRMPMTVWSTAVQRRAYELYLERGGEHGRDVEDWIRSERELRRAARHLSRAAA